MGARMIRPLVALWQSLTGANANRNSDSHQYDDDDRFIAKHTFEILPGEAIGPFRLGMTREQVREIAQRDLGSDIEASKFGEAGDLDRDSIGDTGLMVDYDGNGHANCVWGSYGWARSACGTPDSAFMLFGKNITGMNDAKVIQLCESHWTDVLDRHFSIDVPSAGLSFTYWENATDGSLCTVDVLPPES